MSEFVVRLWTFDGGEARLPETTVLAETPVQAAALALRRFAVDRPLYSRSYLQCEPSAGQHLRVHDVVEWLQSTAGREFIGNSARMEL